uniref:Si:dkey-238d18.12 n=1 Tax=Poecilia latipinna TaxID=48699 RepID=A0A3B3UZF7_9TELE
MPRNIKGLLNSCLVIPCSFDYNRYPPKRADRVVWYQYVSRGYPLVCDNWYPRKVISKYRGRTYVYTSTYKKSCTLEIERVNWNDHRQKLYPWVDPDNVGYRTYAFYDTTVTIEVIQPQRPQIMIFGERKVGNSVTVQCSAQHTCSTRPPTLSFNIAMKDKNVIHTQLSDGTSKTTLTSTLVLEKDFQVVKCTVEHPGGKTATTSETLTAQLTEGVAKSVICSVSYKCKTNTPTIEWNFSDMLYLPKHKKISSNTYTTESNLTFIGSLEDNGKPLTCTAHFVAGETSDSSLLQIK